MIDMIAVGLKMEIGGSSHQSPFSVYAEQ